MHIAEGYLALLHCAGWAAAVAPHPWVGVRPQAVPLAEGDGGPTLEEHAAGQRIVWTIAIAFGLLLTSLELPSVADSSRHPTGMALGTALISPRRLASVASGILLLQALLLAHGGLTTLEANVWSPEVVCPWVTLEPPGGWPARSASPAPWPSAFPRRWGTWPPTPPPLPS